MSGIVAPVVLDRPINGAALAHVTAVRVENVRKPAGHIGFAVHPRRWVLERLCVWRGRNRRLTKDFEAPIGSAQAFLYAASITRLLRRLARSGGVQRRILASRRLKNGNRYEMTLSQQGRRSRILLLRRTNDRTRAKSPYWDARQSEAV